jgi:hypothetical protein
VWQADCPSISVPCATFGYCGTPEIAKSSNPEKLLMKQSIVNKWLSLDGNAELSVVRNKATFRNWGIQRSSLAAFNVLISSNQAGD